MFKATHKLIALFAICLLTACNTAPIAQNTPPAEKTIPSPPPIEKIVRHGIEGKWEGVIINGATLTYISLEMVSKQKSKNSWHYTGKADALFFNDYLKGNSAKRNIPPETINFTTRYNPHLKTFHLKSSGRGRGGRLGLHAHLINFGGVHDSAGGALAGLKQRSFGHRHEPNTGNQYFIFMRPEKFKKAKKTFKNLSNPAKANMGAMFSRFGGTSKETLRKWAHPLYTEYPGLDLNRSTYGTFELNAIKLFRDTHFKQYFGESYDKLSPRQLTSTRMALINLRRSSKNVGDKSTSILERMFWCGRGDNAAIQTALWVIAQRHLLNWHQKQIADLETLPTQKKSFKHIKLLEKEINKIAATLLWPSEHKAVKQKIASNRRRISLPILKAMLADFKSSSPSEKLMNQLLNWRRNEAQLFSHLNKTQSLTLLDASNKRLEQVITAVLPPYRQRIHTLGNGFTAINRGNAWYADFSSTFSPILKNHQVQNVFKQFKQQRSVHLDQAKQTMLAKIQTRYNALPQQLSKSADNSRVRYVSFLKKSANTWFAVPGDHTHPATKSVTIKMTQLGGQTTSLLPPRLANNTGFKLVQAPTITDRPYQTHYLTRVHRSISERSSHRSNNDLITKFFPKPIRNATFQFKSNVVWALFHGRFDELDPSHYKGQGRGSDIAAGWLKTNPRVHYAFVTYAGLASGKKKTRLVGPPVQISWKTTRGGKVEREGWGKIILPKSLASHYERSYKLARDASKADALPGLFLEMARSGPFGIFKKTSLRPDGEIQVACADWEKAILEDLKQLLDSWPPQSYGLWQVQENILRYLKGRPSLQSLYGYRS